MKRLARPVRPARISGWLGAALGMMVALAAAFTASARDQESARPTPVEVSSPAEPVPATADGKHVLAYELHITNFGKDPLTLRRIEVFGGDKNEPLATFEGPALEQMVSLVGAPMAMGSPEGKGPSEGTRFDPGRRLIVYLWLALPLPEEVPASLRHRLSFKHPSVPKERELPLDDDVVGFR